MKMSSVIFVVFALLFGATGAKAGDNIFSPPLGFTQQMSAWDFEEETPEEVSDGHWIFLFGVGGVIHDVWHEMAHEEVAEKGRYPFDCGPFYSFGKVCLGDSRENPKHQKRFFSAGLMSSMELTDRMMASGRRDPLVMGIGIRGIIDQISYPTIHLLKKGGYGDFQSWEGAGGSEKFSMIVLGVGLARLGALVYGINPAEVGLSMEYNEEAGEISLLYTKRF